METAGVLKAEKERTDVLLVRQFNLINCFSSAKPGISESSIGTDVSGTVGGWPCWVALDIQ